MNWNGKRILVTGAGGFIGSHLCEALIDRGARVTALAHYNSASHYGNLQFLSPEKRDALEIVLGNVEDSAFVSDRVKSKDFVFHLAALIGIPYSYVAPYSYLKTNIEGTLNILQASLVHGVQRVVTTSTSETYGSALYTPMDEKHPLQAQSPYSASKIAADKLAESFHLSFGLPVTTVRPFNTFGPRQSARAVIPTIVAQALTQPAVSLGSLFPIRDLNYVKDTVEGFLSVAASEDAVGKVLNLGTGQGVSVGNLAKHILALMRVEKPIRQDEARVRPENSEVVSLICNSEEAHRTGWKPRFSLDEGLEQTIEFIKQNPWLYNPSQYAV